MRQAVAAAVAGDVIRVSRGTYSGNLLLDRPVTLEGEGRPVLRGEGRGSVITITAPGCKVRGFAIEHSGGMLVDEDSGILLRSDGNRVEDNTLRDILFGIYLFQSSHTSISGNSITGRAALDVGARGGGLHVWNSFDNTIVDNTIKQTRDGMYVQNAYQSTIRGNRVSDVRYGLHYMFSDDNRFEDNQFCDNVAGAAIMYSHRIEFRRNEFRHNRGVSSYGILFQASDDCVAEDNLIADNAVGIFMETLRTSTFRHNVFAANDTALQIFASADANRFQANNFIDNLSPLAVIGKRTTTQWSVDGRGNYWSDYSGYDLDGNGIGDVPFRIQNVFEHLEGDLPPLRLYFLSPAAQALAAAETHFPVIEGSQEFDRHPLMKPAPIAVAFRTRRKGAPWGTAILLVVVAGAFALSRRRG